MFPYFRVIIIDPHRIINYFIQPAPPFSRPVKG